MNKPSTCGGFVEVHATVMPALFQTLQVPNTPQRQLDSYIFINHRFSVVVFCRLKMYFVILKLAFLLTVYVFGFCESSLLNFEHPCSVVRMLPNF